MNVVFRANVGKPDREMEATMENLQPGKRHGLMDRVRREIVVEGT